MSSQLQCPFIPPTSSSPFIPFLFFLLPLLHSLQAPMDTVSCSRGDFQWWKPQRGTPGAQLPLILLCAFLLHLISVTHCDLTSYPLLYVFTVQTLLSVYLCCVLFTAVFFHSLHRLMWHNTARPEIATLHNWSSLKNMHSLINKSDWLRLGSFLAAWCQAGMTLAEIATSDTLVEMTKR